MLGNRRFRTAGSPGSYRKAREGTAKDAKSEGFSDLAIFKYTMLP